MTDAPLGRRLAARVLDLLFAIPVTFALVLLLTLASLPVALLFPTGSTPDDLLGSATIAVAFLLAFVGQEWLLLVRRDGQTLGKRLLGLRVLSTDGTPLPAGKALTRLLVLLAPLVLHLLGAATNGPAGLSDVLANGSLAVLGASLARAARRRHGHQALHDLAAGSRVVLAPRRTVDLNNDRPLLADRARTAAPAAAAPSADPSR